MVNREDIIWLYRCILGREPESDDAIDSNLRQFSSFEQARSAFLDSREFQINNRAMGVGSACYVPARHRPFAKPVDKVGLSAIVKNEFKRLPDMLYSAIPLVDFVSLVDTGSEDDTVNTARNILANSQVEYRIECIDFVDFSHARNMSIDMIPERIEWIIILDADERLVQEDYQKFVDIADFDGIDAWNLPRFNFNDAIKSEPAAPYPDYQSRMFRNRLNNPIRFEGAVHEVLINVGRWGIAPSNGPAKHQAFGGPHIHHMGQVDLTVERFNEKHQFYERLMKRIGLTFNQSKPQLKR